MKLVYRLSFILGLFLVACQSTTDSPSTSNQEEKGVEFDPQKDFLLGNFDCKTDVDDLHSIAAFATIFQDSAFANIKHHAVAGAYGVQDGLYVPPNSLFQLSLGSNWTDAHEKGSKAVDKVYELVAITLKEGGNIWIAEAGQSDFSAALVKKVQTKMPEVKTPDRIHVVQHSDWNEEVTDKQALAFVQAETHYHKIPDGNAEGNGTPGFRTPEFEGWRTMLTDSALLSYWELAVDLGHQYNGKEGRYLNEAIKANGLDFSDHSEVCWILGLADLKDTEAYFQRFGK
ncbi:MAG: hypothetical protein AAFY71_10325 [Bacteroidota bacterium]